MVDFTARARTHTHAQTRTQCTVELDAGAAGGHTRTHISTHIGTHISTQIMTHVRTHTRTHISTHIEGTPLNLTMVLPAAIPRRSATVPGCTYLRLQSRESTHSPKPDSYIRTHVRTHIRTHVRIDTARVHAWPEARQLCKNTYVRRILF